MLTRRAHQARTQPSSPPAVSTEMSKVKTKHQAANAKEVNNKSAVAKAKQPNAAKAKTKEPKVITYTKASTNATKDDKSSMGTPKAKSSTQAVRSPLVRPSPSITPKSLTPSTKALKTQSIKGKVKPTTTYTDNDQLTIINLRELNCSLLEKIKELENEVNQLKHFFEELKSSTQDVPKIVSNFVQESLDVLSDSDSTFSEGPVHQIQPPIDLLDISDTDVTTQLDPPLAPQQQPDITAPTIVHLGTPKLLVIGDSMGRDFGNTLSALLPEYEVSAQIYPGCTLETILSYVPELTLSFTKRDIVFIIAGVNNIPHLYPTLLQELLERYNLIFQKTNFILSNVPYVFHESQLNSNIFSTNLSLIKYSSVYKYHMFNCNLFLARLMYTKHGLHFNMNGKQEFCKKLAESVRHFQSAFFVPSVLLNQGIFL